MKHLSVVILLLFTWTVQAQQVKFYSQIDAKQVVEGSTFTIQFSIENADADNFSPPNFSPFKIISGPSQSFRSTFINGKSSKSTTYGYMLQAVKPGKYTIPAATLTLRGKETKSNTVSIEVLKADQVVKTGDPEILIKAEVDSNLVFIGQQVVIRYKIYTQINIENYNILSESKYAGCFAQALDTYKEPVLKEVLGGKEFSTKVLRKVAVFPQQGGKIEIEPMVVQVGIPSKSRVSRGLLSSFGLERKNLSTNGITLIAKSAHDQAPDHFSGAVGNFQVRFQVRPNKVTTDDAISLVLRISGNGDVKTIRPPAQVIPEGFEAFDPKVRDEKMINATDSVRGEKIIEYLLIGHKPGQYQLKPSFVYYNPAAGHYLTITDSFPISISQGTGVLSNIADNSLTPEEAIKPISHSLTLQKVRKPMYLRPWYAAAYILPAFAFLFFSWRSSQKRDETIEIDPQAVAKERLEMSKQYMDRSDYKLFYEEVAYSLKQFISHKLEISAADLSKQNISKVLADNEVAPELIKQTHAMLERCDYALYAGLQDTSSVQSTYTDAVELLTALDKV